MSGSRSKLKFKLVITIINLVFLYRNGAAAAGWVAEYPTPGHAAAQPEAELADSIGEQSLQLILGKLLPSLWAANAAAAAAASAASHEPGAPPEAAGQPVNNEPQSYVTSGAPAASQAQQWQQPAGGLAAADSSPIRQLVTPHSNSLYYPPEEQVPAAHYSNLAQRPAGGAPARPYAPALQVALVPVQQPPVYAGPQQPQQPAWNLLAFLANNKANLSNLIQLLPLLAQTLTVLPKVFAATSGGDSRRPLAELLAGLLQQQLPQSPRKPPFAGLSERENSRPSNQSLADKFAERLQVGESQRQNSSAMGQQQLTRPSSAAASWLVLGELLPRLAGWLAASGQSNFDSLGQSNQPAYPLLGNQLDLSPPPAAGSGSSLWRQLLGSLTGGGGGPPATANQWTRRAGLLSSWLRGAGQPASRFRRLNPRS